MGQRFHERASFVNHRRLVASAALVLLVGGCGGDAGTVAELEQRIAELEAEQQSQTVDATTTTVATTTTIAPTTTRATTTTTRATTTTTTTPPVVRQEYTGTGNDVVDVDIPEGVAALIHVEGNAQGRYFGVRSYDDLGNRLEGLVNTTDPYAGTRPLDFSFGDHTARLEIEASDGWTITILPASEGRSGEAPGTITGTGDDVVIVFGEFDTAHIVGNRDSRYFGVTAWTDSRDGLVNTTDPYDGRVILPSGSEVMIIEVEAVGDWTIVFE
jgi:hypothetical protein